MDFMAAVSERPVSLMSVKRVLWSVSVVMDCIAAVSEESEERVSFILIKAVVWQWTVLPQFRTNLFPFLHCLSG